MKPVPHFPRPPLSLIVDDLPPFGVKLFVGDAEAAADKGLLEKNDIAIVVNCAVNLDINYASEAGVADQTPNGPFRNYKLGLIDDDGNPATMVLAGYYLLDGALRQRLPNRPTYPHRRKGNVLLHCRGGRSRSVILAALYLHIQMADRFPTLDSAIGHIRKARALHPDEWFETPKPMLIEAARFAARWIRRIEDEKEQSAHPAAASA
ncbi:dual specificity protein phosphatase family protein [Microvirga alba]|uniref:Dual specificity protein phosphatase family protein n=1 Tax=Microvirga alba TaxID=2791025 RepID=A0A931FPX6_9HYPH|nr:dual specificity protein phosphatase [Microvirga alba]MBF9235250.1 dual specificity protein phosphatase family protein [Microvirga alba]